VCREFPDARAAIAAWPEAARVPLADVLDAYATLWTALRWARGEAEVLGGEVDDCGVPMRIVV
jgi:hypothetical protein